MYKKISFWVLLTLCMALIVALILPTHKTDNLAASQKTTIKNKVMQIAEFKQMPASETQIVSSNFSAISSYPLFIPERTFITSKKTTDNSVEMKEELTITLPQLPLLVGILEEDGNITAFFRKQDEGESTAVPLGNEVDGWIFEDINSDSEVILSYKDSVRKVGLDWGKKMSDNSSQNVAIPESTTTAKEKSLQLKAEYKPLRNLKERLANIESNK